LPKEEKNLRIYIGHHCQGCKIGMWVFYGNLNGKLQKFHFRNDQKIGCVQFENFQYFYKTPDKTFGEQIRWKEK